MLLRSDLSFRKYSKIYHKKHSRKNMYPVLDMFLNLVSQIVFFSLSVSLFCRTQDCVNGTLLKEIPLPQPTINFTSFLNIYEKSLQYPVDPTNIYVPAQRSLTIYNSSRLYINFEGCVNTLKGECKDFLVTHGRDGDNQTAQSRYPCYYNKVSQFLFEFHVFLLLRVKKYYLNIFTYKSYETNGDGSQISFYLSSVFNYY